MPADIMLEFMDKSGSDPHWLLKAGVQRESAGTD
jgi:hypothetical protein